MANFLAVGGGFGNAKPDIALLGVMYWKDMDIGFLHKSLSLYHRAPAIYVRQGDYHRNRPKRDAVWGFYSGGFSPKRNVTPKFSPIMPVL